MWLRWEPGIVEGGYSFLLLHYGVGGDVDAGGGDVFVAPFHACCWLLLI